MNFVDDTQALMHLGLTNSQAKVYLALYRLGTDNKGTTIAKFADVPRKMSIDCSMNYNKSV
jgi:hypothetical protein